jgi:hypothetical protein
MNIWLYTVCWNERYMMPFFLRHYAPWVDRIVVLDEHSDDGTAEVVKACPKAVLRFWPYRGLDDDCFRAAQSCFYKEARGQADWVLWPDVDEFLWHPDPRGCLERCRADLVNARGFNLTPDAPPVDDGRSQFYDLCRMGVPSENYSKSIIWRPEQDIVFDYGRHGVMQFSGRRTTAFDFKLFHAHFLGENYTRERNERNLSRVRERRFAWNYLPEYDTLEQPGTLSWVRHVLSHDLRVDVLRA